jgi:hypothetical protein
VTKINKKTCTLSGTDTLVTEASDIGLAPGELPDFIAVVDDNDEGFLFFNPQPDIHNGEIAGWYYQRKNGNGKLLVIND